jgi:hypothetical protein
MRALAGSNQAAGVSEGGWLDASVYAVQSAALSFLTQARRAALGACRAALVLRCCQPWGCRAYTHAGEPAWIHALTDSCTRIHE